MAKTEKLIERLLCRPKDLTWDELCTILSFFGYERLKAGKTGGSRRKFSDSEKNVICLHEPHPQKIVKPYQIKLVIEYLKEKGKITDG